MVFDIYPSEARILPTPAVLPLRVHPGASYWQGSVNDQLTVRLLLVPRSRIAVDLWWNRCGGLADVQLVFGLYGDSVELGSLTGNGFDAPAFHRMGFGTLAVNVGVQALQAVCRPQVLVHGVLSNTAEESLPVEQRAPLEAGRRAFWRRFGLDVVDRGSPPMDYLRGNVGALRLVSNGLLAGQFSRNLPLTEFGRSVPAGF